MSIQQLIAGSVAPNQNSLMEMDAAIERSNAYRAQNALADRKMQAYDLEQQQASALRAAYAGGADPSTPEGQRTLFAAGADPKALFAAGKERALTGKAEAETQKTQAGLALQTAEFMLRDPTNEQAVIGALKFGARHLPGMNEVIAKLEPLRGTPQFGETAGQFAMSGKERAQQQLNADKFAETQKQSGIDNAFQQGNLNVAQANAADMIRHRGVMENKPASGFSMSYDEQGRPVISTGGMMPKLTESQGKATALGMRGGEAVDQLNAIEDSGYVPDTATQAKQFAGNMLGSKNRFLDATAQKYEQAMLNFGTAIGRFESGAAIPETEWQRFIDQYSARPGSTPEEIAQKRQNRETAIRGMGVSAGPGRAALPPSPNLPPTEVAAQPSGRQEFDAMPMPGEYAGKRIKTPEGIVYRSNGSKWIRQ